MMPHRSARRALPLLLLAVAACETPPPPASPAAGPTRDTVLLSREAVAIAGFTTVVADSQPWRETWRVPARLVLDAAHTATLGAIAEGRITEVLVRPGDAVRAGQVLVRIHSHELTTARSELARAEANVAQSGAHAEVAAAAAARATRLHAARALSLADLQKAQADAAAAAAMRTEALAERERAQVMVDHLVGDGPTPHGADGHEVLIRAPIAGTIIRREAQPGTVVLVGAPLVTVSRLTTLQLVAQLPERAVAAARSGSDVRFTATAYPERVFTARVTRVAPALDPVTRTLEVHALVEDPEGLLRAEMAATAELLGPPGARTLVVPGEAVQALDGDTVVIVATPRGAATHLEAVRVRAGRRTGASAEIVAGLAAGTTVVAGRAAVAKAEIAKQLGAEP